MLKNTTTVNSSTGKARTNSTPIAATWVIVNRVAQASTAPPPVAVSTRTTSTTMTVPSRCDWPPCITPATAATATAAMATTN